MRFLILTISVLLAGCTTAPFKQKTILVSPGDDKATVLAKMKRPPQDRQFGEGREALQWCADGDAQDAYFVVLFRNDKAEETYSYHQGGYGACDEAFKRVDFKNPASIIEVRER